MFFVVTPAYDDIDASIVVDRLLITQTKTKQTNPIPKNDESLMSSANSN